MLTLYHNDFSTCAQKVRIVFAEKDLEWEGRHLDLAAGDQHQPDYVKLNPNKVVPTLVHDGQVLIESSLIADYLDGVFSAGSLSPSHPYERYRMHSWVRRVDDQVHMATGLLMAGIGMRPMLLRRSPEERQAIYAAYENREVAERRRSVIEEGLDSPWLQGALRDCVATLDEMERQLRDGPWLAGADFSLADIGLAVNLQRYDELQLSPLLASDSRPRVADWLERVRARPSWAAGVEKWAPAPRRELLRKNGQAAWPGVAELIAQARPAAESRP